MTAMRKVDKSYRGIRTRWWCEDQEGWDEQDVVIRRRNGCGILQALQC